MLDISIYLSASHSHLANILSIFFFFLMLGIMLGPRDTRDKQYWIPALEPLSVVCPKVSYIYSGAEKLED